MIKAVLFDLDGTLADSLADLAASTNYALKAFGFPVHETRKYKKFVGDGIPKLIERAIPKSARGTDFSLKVLDYFMEHYRVHYHDKTCAYNGIPALLEQLRHSGIKIAVISNKAQEMAEKVVNKLFGDMGDMFDMVAGKREGYPAKPDPALTLEVIAGLGAEPRECVFAGDSGMDMAVAVNCGAVPVGVLWGFRTKEELLQNGAEYLAEKPNDIFEIIKRINHDFS